MAACGALCATAAIPAPAAAATPIRPATPRPTSGVVINVVKAKGSGCKSGSYVVALSPDFQAFTVTYSGYLAQVGPGVPTDDKNCNLTLKVGVPKGYTYALAGADYRGYANLAGGANGVETSDYYFQGPGDTVTTTHQVSGPMDDDWEVSDPQPPIYEACGKQRQLNIDTDMTINAASSDPNATSYMTMDSADGSITTYHLAWRTC
jgi:hypothetical protein